jgi:DNA polymerase-3 subunit gamma/tau
MVLIRLCHVSDLPPPGDLVKKFLAQGGGAAPAPAHPPNGGGGARAMAGGIAPAASAPFPATALAEAPRPKTFRDVVALASAERELMLHGHLLHSVHLVRFAPPVIELRPQPDAPRDLAAKLGALLQRVTGERWTIAISAAAGEPTLAEQGESADRTRRSTAADHPLVRAILEAFPGARIDAVRDPGVDAYGLPALPGEDISLGEPGTPGYTSDDPEDGLVEPADLMEAPILDDSEYSFVETAR